ncbi:MAG: hypothetical protein BWZ02_03099 [Lentisphaerae bacterium ADurb.BinA184]|nr:MAG: hypothetical protein BWZ02_03099 [Lentisphaerae bacterium ADurb.BinA184]
MDEAALLSTLRLRIPRRDASGREQLVPADRYYFSCLLRLAETGSRSRLSVDLVTAAGESVAITSLQRATEANYSDRGAFRRIGEPYVNLPSEPGEHVELVFTLEGPGRAAVADVVFFSNEAIARLYKGSTEVRRGDLERVPESERGSLLVRPDNLASPAGVWYVLKGYVPYRQWLVPLVYWMSIVLAVFLCTLGMGVILRRQWADNERFPFPLVMLPRLLIEDDPGGRPGLRPIFRKRTFQAGVVAAFVYTGLLGLAFYIPNLPSPKVSVNLVQYVDSPAMKAFMQGMAGANFEIIILMVAVAFFIDLDMLLSILVFFWLSRIPYFLGEVFGWKNIRGPIDWYPFPHEQHLGAFLGLALIVLWVSRKHLRAAALRILGRGGVSDAGEIMSYRAALAAIIVSFVFFALWGVSSGLGAVPALVFFGFIVVCGLSAARIRTECGVPWTYFTPYYPHLVFFMLGGLAVFGTSTLVLSFCVGGFMAVAQFLMFAPSQVEMMHLGNTFNANPKGIRRALILGLIGGVIIGGYVMLVWAYGRGGENIKYMKDWGLHQDWYLRTLRDSVTDANAQMMSAAGEVARGGRGSAAAPIIASGIGLGVTVLLVALRSLFVGFWLHPIGYVLANAHFSYMCWGSLLVAWLIRLLSLKLGGPRLVREHMAPLMAGAFCGALLGMAVWDVIGLAALGCGVRNIFTPFP